MQFDETDADEGGRYNGQPYRNASKPPSQTHCGHMRPCIQPAMYRRTPILLGSRPFLPLVLIGCHQLLQSRVSGGWMLCRPLG